MAETIKKLRCCVTARQFCLYSIFHGRQMAGGDGSGFDKNISGFTGIDNQEGFFLHRRAHADGVIISYIGVNCFHAAIAGNVEIRPMMYIALSYDHRIVDGQQAVLFLVRIKELVEDPAAMLIS